VILLLDALIRPAEQTERLPFLLEWMAGADEWEGDPGRDNHRKCFLAHDGPRTHRRESQRPKALSPEVSV
jgi:hypothetical protein